MIPVELDCPACVALVAGAPRHVRIVDPVLGEALELPDAYPELHYGVKLERLGNACPNCGRRWVVLEPHPRSQASVTRLALRRPDAP